MQFITSTEGTHSGGTQPGVGNDIGGTHLGVGNEIGGTQPGVGNEIGATQPGVGHEIEGTVTEICNQVHQDTAPTQFTYEYLKEATNNFAHKLGQGGFGSVYKGFRRESNSFIAVKRVSSGSRQGIKEYLAEVQILCTLRYNDLVKLLGWCHERREELLLVYEYMPEGSLYSHLFDSTRLMDWRIRHQAAKDLASALVYLQEKCYKCVLHRDIKSTNILLDADFKAKLGDFGLARVVDHGHESYSTNPAGTRGYMAPELEARGASASKATDVYSFGVVALEIATGKKAIHESGEATVSLVQLVWSKYRSGKLDEAADPRIVCHQNMEELRRLMTVGLWCANPNSSSSRPSIIEAEHVLNGGPLPILTSSVGTSSSQCPLPVLTSSLGTSSSQYVTAECPLSVLTSSVVASSPQYVTAASSISGQITSGDTT